MTTTWTTEVKGTGAYAEVNGLNMYYEIHGAGRPMILLHGGLGSGEMFGPILPALSASHRVIAPDLQGHGRTADIDRPIDERLMADDIAGLIDHLELDKPDIVGYSLGGGVAFHTAVKYPEKVRRLVAGSIYFRSDDVHAELKPQQGQVNASAVEFMKETPMWELYQKVAPRPEDFGRLLDKIGAMMKEPFDYTDELRSIKVPTMLVAADADQAPPSALVDALQAARRRPPGRWLDGRASTRRRARPGDPARLDALQRFRLAALRGGHPRLPGSAVAPPS